MKNIVANWLNNLRVEGKPDEWESKNLLKLIGLNVPAGRRILPDEVLQPSALEFLWFLRSAIRLFSIRRSRRGEAQCNCTKLFRCQQELKNKFPSSPLLAEAMCRIEGTEFILGGLVDPVFGPAVMAGAGGVLTELYEDAVFRLCPCSKAEAMRMLDELKISPVLKGYRGSRLELEPLADAVSKISSLFDAFDGRLNQIDINPMVYTGENWTALDCVLILN